MRATDDKTIRAFLMALEQLDSPLSQAALQTVHAAGAALVDHQPEIAAHALHTLAETDPTLTQHYQNARSKLTQQYNAQERSKNLAWAAALPQSDFEQLAAKILTALDGVQPPRQLMSNLIPSSKQKTDFWERADRIVVMAGGGAFLGGALAQLIVGVAIAQVPGAIVGALLAASYGWYIGFGKRTIPYGTQVTRSDR